MLSFSIILSVSAIISAVCGIKNADGKGKIYILIGALLALCAIIAFFSKGFALFSVVFIGFLVKEITNSLKVKYEAGSSEG